MKNKIKIAMLTPWGRKTRCGIKSYSENLTYALSKQGVEVYIVRLHRLGVKDKEYFEWLATSRIPDVSILHVQHEYGLFNYFEEVFYTTLRNAWSELKVVSTLHGAGGFPQDKYIARYSDIVIVHNRFQAEKYSYPCIIIPHGVSIRKPVDRRIARRKFGLKFKDKVVGWFGFISPQKGVEDLIYAAGKLGKIKFLVCGGWHVDYETGYIAKLKRNSPSNVKYLGYLEDDMLPFFFGACNLIIHTSRFVSESGSLLTAIGYGKAVIARDLSPNREKPILGWYKDRDALTVMIEEALKDKSRIRSAEKRAVKYALENSWMKTALKQIQIYLKLQ